MLSTFVDIVLKIDPFVLSRPERPNPCWKEPRLRNYVKKVIYQLGMFKVYFSSLHAIKQ